MSRGPWHVAVLMGGTSNERAVSLSSGDGVADALEERGHTVTRVDFGVRGADGKLRVDSGFIGKLIATNPDVIFNALHGVPGEDGTVQGALDLIGIPYTHSGLVTSVIAIDKELTKQRLVPNGVPMPAGVIVSSDSVHDADPLPRPYVLKPVNEGSSVGVAIVRDDSNYGNPIARDAVGPWQQFDELLAEPFIKGRELTVAVLGDETLGVTELVVSNGFYDYDAKYTAGLTRHVYPAEIPAEIAGRMEQLALASHRLLGCKGTSRSDFRWDDELGIDGIFLLEVNTQPGMTPLSLVPEQAKHRGISYGELVERIIEEAL